MPKPWALKQEFVDWLTAHPSVWAGWPTVMVFLASSDERDAVMPRIEHLIAQVDNKKLRRWLRLMVKRRAGTVFNQITLAVASFRVVRRQEYVARVRKAAWG